MDIGRMKGIYRDLRDMDNPRYHIEKLLDSETIDLKEAIFFAEVFCGESFALRLKERNTSTK